MATATPEQVRSDLQALTGAAAAQLAVAAAPQPGESAEAVRGVLFETAGVLAEAYKDAAAELAVGWYDELRTAADLATGPAGGFDRFTATPVADFDADAFATSIAVATQPLYDLIQADIDRLAADFERQLVEAVAASLARVEAEMQKEIASGFRDTITANTERDDAAVGWRRHTRPSDSYTNGCRWCRFLADKGAIYSKATARFAAHKKCHCVASPVFEGQDGPEASVMQYVASKRQRTKAENKRLRNVLDERYGPEEPHDRHRPDAGTDPSPAAPTPAAEGGGRGSQPPPLPPSPAPGFGDEPDPRDREAHAAYWAARQAALGIAAHGEQMQPDDIKLAEHLQRANQSIEWIRRDANGYTETGGLKPTDDFIWLNNNQLAVEGKRLNRAEYKVIKRAISDAVADAAPHGFTKSNFVIDLGDKALTDKLRHQLSLYNVRNAASGTTITGLWVLSRGEIHKIDLQPPA
ncbi:hypothetical protein [Pimelobacter simplex]|uniref:VG15 protein n=1 Tax=Nocardioides simplex TaxID=2045 RepID=UPI003AAD0637